MRGAVSPIAPKRLCPCADGLNVPCRVTRPADLSPDRAGWRSRMPQIRNQLEIVVGISIWRVFSPRLLPSAAFGFRHLPLSRVEPPDCKGGDANITPSVKYMYGVPNQALKQRSSKRSASSAGGRVGSRFISPSAIAHATSAI